MPAAQRKTEPERVEPTEEDIRRKAHPEWYSDLSATAVDQAPSTDED